MNLTCRRCGHQWQNREDRKPKSCPNCKTYRYDEPKQQRPRP
jgi:predicted Zn-ribbon and HTH transcriptional regulator